MNRKERRAARKQGLADASARSLPAEQITRMFAQAVRHRRNGELIEAEALCRSILAANSTHAGSLHLLGNMALHFGRPDAAVKLIDQAIASRPGVAAYHDDRGLALNALGRPHEAVTEFGRAIRLDSGSARSFNNLAVTLLAQGQHSEAAAQFVNALKLTPELFESYGDLCATLYKLYPFIEKAVGLASTAWPRRLAIDELFGSAGLAAVADEPLLRCLLVSAPVRDIALERLLTSIRAGLLKIAMDETAKSDRALRFCCAMAQQCFIDEYVFATTAEELESAEQLRQSLAAAMAAKNPVAPFKLAAFGCYCKLETLPDAQMLLAMDWPEVFDELLTQHLREPATEQQLRESIPLLSAIEDVTSLRVKQQYEDNPYPRWILPPSKQKPMSVAEYLAERFPFAPLKVGAPTEGAEILVAGCGTGRHPSLVAQLFKGARVLAVDLSLASLAYAQRKARELRLSNIDYAQADLLTLGRLGRTFDLIDAGGVLHHLTDPSAGWRALIKMLRPNGLMRIGLYSEIARRDVAGARDYCVERGYRPNAETIRAVRHELIASRFKSLVRFNDFFSLSECRDLLFHAQEHRFSIPQIREFIDAEGLRLIGFDATESVYSTYRKRFPDDPAMLRFDYWDQLETEQPDTFASMYQFWVQKQ